MALQENFERMSVATKENTVKPNKSKNSAAAKKRKSILNDYRKRRVTP